MSGLLGNRLCHILHLCWGNLLCLFLVPIIMVVLECYTITWSQVILQTLKPTIRPENIVPKKCHGRKIYPVTFWKARSKDRKQCLLGIIPLEACDTLLLGMQIFCGTHGSLRMLVLRLVWGTTKSGLTIFCFSPSLSRVILSICLTNFAGFGTAAVALPWFLPVVA